jgi:hypothetical protein
MGRSCPHNFCIFKCYASHSRMEKGLFNLLGVFVCCVFLCPRALQLLFYPNSPPGHNHKLFWNLMFPFSRSRSKRLRYSPTSWHSNLWLRQKWKVIFTSRPLYGPEMIFYTLRTWGWMSEAVWQRQSNAARRPSLGAQTKFVNVRYEVFTAVTMKNGVFWDVTPCGLCKNRRFGGT